MGAVTGAVIGGVSAAVGIASAVQSFQEADRQANLAKAAAQESKDAMQAAKDRAQVNYYEQLSLPMGAYDAALEASLAGQQTAIEALQEGDPRNLAAGVGKVGAIATQRDEAVRNQMASDMFALDKMKADSRDAINQQLLAMDVSFAREQNQRQRDAERLRAQQIEAGFSGVTSAMEGASSTIPLYTKGVEGRRYDKISELASGIEGFDALSATEQKKALDVIAKDKKLFKQMQNINPDQYRWDDTKKEFIFNAPLPTKDEVGTLLEGIDEQDVVKPIMESDRVNQGINFMTANPNMVTPWWEGLGLKT